MARTYEVRFVEATPGDVVDILGHGNVRSVAVRSARRELSRRGLIPDYYDVRSCRFVPKGELASEKSRSAP